MTLNRIIMGALASTAILLTGCGNAFEGNDFASRGPASPEPAYYGKPTAMLDQDSVRVTMTAKFLYRQLHFADGDSTSGLKNVVALNNAAPIPFAEFHIYDSSGTRVQQGETTTNGTAEFKIPKTAGTYTLKVFSRALNDYIKVSVLEDIYNNNPYSISQNFTISTADINAGTKDLSSTPVYAHGDEGISSKIEGGAFNIMFNILLANEYVRRNIDKNGDVAGTPVPNNTEKWWVADKVTVFWKAGFNPYTYFNGSSPLSFYSPGERKLYVLGGVSGDVRSSDTDHFDDSVILHEYAHFLEDVYGSSESPGGSHTGNFVIDPRLAWSEGWANYFQAAVLTGADAPGAAGETGFPGSRNQYYVDTYGYNRSPNNVGISIAFSLAENGRSAAFDNVTADLPGTGTFREVSISRTLYKSSRRVDALYDTNKKGGGISFKNYWKVFSGEEKGVYTRLAPAPYSLVQTDTYPISNMGLFNWLLTKNSTSGTEWDAILSEEKQNKTTKDYAYHLTPDATSSNCSYDFTTGTMETTMGIRDPIKRSNQQVNNDFFLYYHDGSAGNLAITYTRTSGATLNLDLVLYYKSYIYHEDTYAAAGQSSPYIAKQSRLPAGSPEQVNLTGLPAGYYILNVKVNAYEKIQSDLSGAANYIITKNGVRQCGTERP